MEFGRFCEAVGLQLEPFQKRIVSAAAGPERELVVLLPRGQGKTTLLAALAVHHLLTVEDAAVYVAAASRDQARILFEQAAKFTIRLDDPRLVIRHLELRWCEDPDTPKRFSRHLRVLAADALKLHGLTPSLAIIDELHAHFDDSVYLAMRTAAMKRPGSRLVVISTAGQGADSPLGGLRSRALALPQVKRRGGFTDARGPALRLLEWSLREDVDLADMRAVKQVNPASWITLEALQEQREAVPEVAFRRFHAPSGPSASRTGSPPAPGKPASVNHGSLTASRSGSASTSAATRAPQPSSGSTAPTMSASRSTTATRASSTASRRSASSPHATNSAR